MEEIHCCFCGTNQDINVFFKNFDKRDTSKKNIMYCCEKCRNEFNQKIMINAIKACKELGLRVDERGNWGYDNETVREELESVQALKEENRILKENILVWQNKLNSLVLKYGYDEPIQLKKNQYLLLWELKKQFHCPSCGNPLIWFKRNGRYYGNCKCGKSYRTEINRLLVELIE
jgi:predicted RNA-binding Zn-ribbon protein involved in translation (DUF1610 family)/FtsZ-binding cell division protein ZapB